jgi:hypothetical protein
MARTLPEVTTGPRPGAFGRFRSHGISTAQAWLVRHFSWDGGTTITVAAGEPSIPSRGATACRHLSSCRPTRHDKKISLWRSVATDLLLCGQHSGGERSRRRNRSPALGIAQLRKTNTPSSAKTRTLGPASAGLFFVSKHWEPSPAFPDLLWCGRTELSASDNW